LQIVPTSSYNKSTIMFSRIAVLALTCVMAQASVINQSNGDIPLDSDAGRKLVQNARRVANNGNSQYYSNSDGQSQYAGDYSDVNWNDIDNSYIAGYSVKFQGCHHVQQWNDEADSSDDIKILTQRLVRFRMCPADSCSSSTTKGCDSNYGDYLVDMETYLQSYMYQMQSQYSNNNQYNNGNGRSLENNNGMNLEDYMQCSEMEMDDNQRKLARELNNYNNGYNGYYNNNNNQDNDVKYYIGPYCAEQGGEIRLGVFSDDTCSVEATNGAAIFQSLHNGVSLPYSEQSMVNLGCVSCGGYGQVNDFCETLYGVAGKCETKMNVYYPNESSCSYIEGIKVIREDGVIRTTATRKSTAAAVTTGLFLTAAVLLAGYVYYLRTKLGRARINLAASSQNASLS
jgi:hypothetical protein